MAAFRLSDSQKQELVERYRQGVSSQVLAEAYGCSPNTVSRVVKAALDPSAYAELKQQRSRGAAALPTTQVPVEAGEAATDPDTDPLDDPANIVPQYADPRYADTGFTDPESDEAETPAPPTAPVAGEAPDDAGDGAGDGGREENGDEGAPVDPHRVLAIDDADDFADDGQDDADLDGDDEGDPFDASEFVTVPVALAVEDRPPASAQPLQGAHLPDSVYLLVDKTVELQARPLREFPELGPLPSEELDRQALVVFANPRQAKRQCGRSQRVIKVPDSGVLERTAPYLLSQGISRLVLEGALYALPES